ncbi:unnamed protein product [Cuscuta europaea]|uniref:Uncharacterized protein n=1 Tax=Cuscuta europaea TaxID=41803 RepID=A0A9P0YUE6_CUSEU|nr:unnamed protein product [Cuscuta europaea]
MLISLAVCSASLRRIVTLFIPEGRNGLGSNLFLTGIMRALALLTDNTTKLPSLVPDHTSCEDFSVVGCANPISRDFISGDHTEVFDCEDDFGEQFYTHLGDDILGHASESKKRAPISSVEGLWDSDTNQNICNKALLITRENYLLTENLNTQIKMYRKKNQQSHHMRTRSQTRVEY